MFDADRPITSSKEDRLNRALFAKYLARCLLDYHDPESLVVGLYGGWGVGKTSVINLVVEELNFAASNLEDTEKPIVLNFSPWSYSGQQQLIYSFFRRLSSVLRNVSYLEHANRIIHLLELYVSFFTQKPVPKSLRNKRSWRDKIFFRHREDVYAWESGRDLTLIKAELNDLLKQQKHKLIIIIDNISRLSIHEVKQIFQIVKSMGNYTNTVYLLALDKDQIVRAINQVDGSDGEAYLEKIVQLPFDIPPISQQDLEMIFADKLKDIVANVPQDTWNAEYWADIYYQSLKYFFTNCRDITRYVNTLNFSYARLRDVVNPVDFFALTAIQVFVPQLYFGIRDNKDLFTDLLDNVYALNEDQRQKDTLRINEIISRASRIPQEVFFNLLLKLFPRLQKIYFPHELIFHSDLIARKLRRICSPDLFDAYFRLSMQSSQLPQKEFETIITMASDKKMFAQALTRLNQDERITKFLDQLDSGILEDIPPKNAEVIIAALLDNGDLFPQGEYNALSLNTPMRIRRIIHLLLQHFKSTETRFEVLQNAIGAANKSIYIIVYLLQEDAREHHEEEDTYVPLAFRQLTPEELDSLQKLTASRIKQWADDGRLQNHPALLDLLFAWRAWDEQNALDYVEKLTETDPGLLAFLCAALKKPIHDAMLIYEVNATWEKYLDNISAFIPAEKLIPHAKLLFEDPYFEKLHEREQLALMIFLNLMHVETNKIIPKTS